MINEIGVCERAMDDMLEEFFGCYLLYSINPKHKGQTYIGFTKDPNRRINQHNKGLSAGGAWKTSKKGPWEMVLVVYGFPNEIAALRFEWAWQHPGKSRRLSHVSSRQRGENNYAYQFRILSEMLRTTPWSRLCLTIQWLSEDKQLDFHPSALPPLHMPIRCGPVILKGKQKSTSSPPQNTFECKMYTCILCHHKIDSSNRHLHCLSPICIAEFHLICLAEKFLQEEDNNGQKYLIPVYGKCPQCHQQLLWGDLIQDCKKREQQRSSKTNGITTS